MKNIKRTYIIFSFLLVISSLVLCASFAFLTNKFEQHGKLNIVVGDLTYSLESSSLTNNKITVASNTTETITIKLSSLNSISSKYELYYLLNESNSRVSVGYSKDTVDSVSGIIDANGNKEITVIIKNSSDVSTTVEFSVDGGLVNNELVLSQGNSLNTLIKVDAVKTLAQTILDNNEIIEAEPTLSNSSNNTSDASGLYKSTLTNSKDPTYYFRGNVTNNYVDFAGFIWRIVRINEDGTIRLIMSDGINNNATYVYSANSAKSYYSESDIKSTLEEWYMTNLQEFDSYIETSNYCEEFKVVWNTSYGSGNATVTGFTVYKPTYECNKDGNEKEVLNLKIGLLTYDEAVFAGGYPTKPNTQYYLYNGKDNRLMTPAGILNNSATTWILTGTTSTSYSISYGTTGNAFPLRPVINLKADTVMAGSGTSKDPYAIPEKFTDKILTDNTLIEAAPTLTTSSNNTNDASGLYMSTVTNTEDPTYYFRGNVTNNYVDFAGFAWRIVRINEDGTIRLVLQDGINNNTTYQYNTSTDDLYYTNSNAESVLNDWYNTNLSQYSSYIMTGNYYCEQYQSGLTVTGFECSEDVNGHGIVNSNIGLLTYNEAVHAGGYYVKLNTSYYLYNANNYMDVTSTLSYMGNSKLVWYIYTQYLGAGNVTATYRLRPVINLKADTMITGRGTSTIPYNVVIDTSEI